MKRRKKRKLTKAERKVISLRNLAKAHRGRKKSKGYKPRTLSRRRFKKKRVGIKRFGRSRGQKLKVLTTGERRRRTRRRKKNPVALLANPVKRRRRRRRNPWPGQPRRHAKAAKKGWARRRRGKRKSTAKRGGHSKRSMAARKAARTRKRNKAMRAAAGRKAARTRKRKHGGSHKKRSHSKSSKRSSGKRKSPKRVAAAKKGARTRKRNKNRNKRAYKRAGGRRYTPASHQLTAERRRRRHKRRRNPVALLANPIRRRRHSRRRNPLMNPLPNPMHDIRGFLSKAAGFGVGYLIQDGIDRFAATHVLAVDTAGNITDTPPAGTIYDSESPDLPIWSSWQRLAFNAAGLAIPGLMAKFFWKEFWQRALIAATVRTVGKVAVDAVAHFAPPAIAGGLPLRLYGANYAAQAKINQANVGQLPASPAGVFAGIPRMLGLVPAPRQRMLAAPQQQRLLGGCGGCGDGSVSSLMVDPLANSPAASMLAPTPQNSGCGPFNPLTAGTGPSTDVISVTPTPSGGGWGGGGGGGGGEGTIPVFIPPPAQTTTSTPASAPVPSSGSGSGGGQPRCDQGTIGSLTAALAAFNGTGYQPSQSSYNGIAGQLAQCGITAPPWTPPPPPPNNGTVVR